MGELANLANVSKRTIDYYTSLGLLQAKRSNSNYRIYPEEALNDLKLIEEYKKIHLPLHEIKRKLELNNHTELQDRDVEKQMETVTNQIKQLKHDLSVLLPIISKYKQDPMSKKLNEEGTALIESLMRITS
ncbi:MerR family transcriptional regulator [Niallia endozanthoxylica]|uniref:MerR family transcriptional regulator n=2 Tax=Niallia endozanthoxylica TaxID=2036016 RepID=A0A5J5I7E7_9BACI|nr:MerR family transcriptional regulator [Niallia endozanthoxylica]